LLSSLPVRADKTNGIADRRAPLLSRYGKYFAAITAIVLVLVALAFWGGLAHLLAWNDYSWLRDRNVGLAEHYPTLLFGTLLFVTLAALTPAFVNLSSLATFYGARLRRAYVGASNPERIGLAAGSKRRSQATPVDEGRATDDLGLYDYYKVAARGALFI
jgi:hypothetical protein